MTLGRILIVGAGMAGVSAAEELRNAGYPGEVILFNDEGGLPYDRPPLSKAFANGSIDREGILLKPASWYAENDIVLDPNPVTAIDPAAATVTTQIGAVHGYDRLLLATGARARTLAGLAPGVDVVRLRTHDDADRLRTRIRPGSRVVLIGGGVIGMECAATAAGLGAVVTVLEAGTRIMERFFPTVVSEFLLDHHRRHGVDVRLEFKVVDLSTTDGVTRIMGADGTVVEADLVVVGVGSQPNVDLAQAAGLAIESGGVAVDPCGRTTVPGVFAVGDCAAFLDARSGVHERWENWTHARDHARAAARAMLDQPSDYQPTSWVWSDQYQLNIQVTGKADAADVVVRGDPATGKFTALHLDGGLLVGATTVNDGRNKRPIEQLVSRGARFPGEVWADPSVSMKDLAGRVDA